MHVDCVHGGWCSLVQPLTLFYDDVILTVWFVLATAASAAEVKSPDGKSWWRCDSQPWCVGCFCTVLMA